MANRMPLINDKYRICIICEGKEEYKYLDRLYHLGVWNSQYDLTLINADGNGNITARYQDRYQNGSDDVVLIFCDTEKKPYKQYEEIKSNINRFHGRYSAASVVIIFANPCTMQIVIKHWTDELIKSPAKSINAPLIETCTGVANYKGRDDQVNIIMEKITAVNYEEMRGRIEALSDVDTDTGSTNFIKLVSWMESDSTEWIDKINETLE